MIHARAARINETSGISAFGYQPLAFSYQPLAFGFQPGTHRPGYRLRLADRSEPVRLEAGRSQHVDRRVRFGIAGKPETKGAAGAFPEFKQFDVFDV